GPELLELVAHFLTGCPGFPAAYQSEGGTSSNTTHTASRGRLHTSEIVSVTRRAISSLRSLPWPSHRRMLTNGLVAALRVCAPGKTAAHRPTAGAPGTSPPRQRS